MDHPAREAHTDIRCDVLHTSAAGPEIACSRKVWDKAVVPPPPLSQRKWVGGHRPWDSGMPGPEFRTKERELPGSRDELCAGGSRVDHVQGRTFAKLYRPPCGCERLNPPAMLAPPPSPSSRRDATRAAPPALTPVVMPPVPGTALGPTPPPVRTARCRVATSSRGRNAASCKGAAAAPKVAAADCAQFANIQFRPWLESAGYGADIHHALVPPLPSMAEACGGLDDSFGGFGASSASSISDSSSPTLQDARGS